MLCDEEECIKVIVVGDGNVGKTSMLRRFVRGDFIEQYRKTIGAEFMEKDVFLRSSNTTVKLMLWDTAGQEVFNALTQAYYRGAGAAILTFSTVDYDSFLHVAEWKRRVESVCGLITMVLCQTKFDLSHEASMTNTDAEKLADQLGVPLFRVSTKDDFNVTQLFEFTAQQCVERFAQDEAHGENMKGNRLDDGEELVAEVSAVESSSMTSKEQHVSASATAALVPSAAAASSSPPGAGESSSCGGDGVQDPSGKLVTPRSGCTKGKRTAAPSKKNKVSLRERHAQTHHTKKHFKCSLS